MGGLCCTIMPGAEKRLAGDGGEYTHEQFFEHYGVDEAQWWWDQAESTTETPAESAEVPAEYFKALFEEGDANSDGVLSPIEFARVLSLSKFDFPEEVIIQLVQTVDVDENGVIDYEELCSCMASLMEARTEEAWADEADVASDMPLWNQVPADMLERYLEKLFLIGDENGDGVLQPNEFLSLLTKAGLKFPAKLVLNLFLEADTNGDGVIEYGEFMPAMLQVIESLQDEPLTADLERIEQEKQAGEW